MILVLQIFYFRPISKLVAVWTLNFQDFNKEKDLNIHKWETERRLKNQGVDFLDYRATFKPSYDPYLCLIFDRMNCVLGMTYHLVICSMSCFIQESLNQILRSVPNKLILTDGANMPSYSQHKTILSLLWDGIIFQ